MNVPNITFRREKRERKGRKRVEEREERKKNFMKLFDL